MIGTFIRTKFQSLELFGSPLRAGFTLLEFLVVVAVLGVLAALMIPALGRARSHSARAACASNLRQLVAANLAYAADHGHFVAAAEDVWGSNNTRWHGVREARNNPFEPTDGPLAPYLGTGRVVKQCPAFQLHERGFEAGCGGYGYNACGVGSQAYVLGSRAGSVRGMAPGGITEAARTVMFADAAFLANGKLIEYSFAEPVFHVSDTTPPQELYRAMPSIHFRHDGQANVAWADGHVTAESMTVRYNRSFTTAQIGWFGAADNQWFDPF